MLCHRTAPPLPSFSLLTSSLSVPSPLPFLVFPLPLPIPRNPLPLPLHSPLSPIPYPYSLNGSLVAPAYDQQASSTSFTMLLVGLPPFNAHDAFERSAVTGYRSQVIRSLVVTHYHLLITHPHRQKIHPIESSSDSLPLSPLSPLSRLPLSPLSPPSRTSPTPLPSAPHPIPSRPRGVPSGKLPSSPFPPTSRPL